jgi:hypothetical protein
MDSPSAEQTDDLTALQSGRDRLRALAARVVEAIEAIPMPDSFLEAERAARAVTTADRMITRLPQDGDAQTTLRNTLKTYGGRLLDTLETLPLPKTHADGERAGRCVLATERMLTQLHAPRLPKPEARPRFADDLLDDETPPPDNPVDAWNEVQAMIDRATRGYAQRRDIWPDGAPYDRSRDVSDAFAEADASVYARATMQDEPAMRLAELTITRVNAIARAAARRDGRWPDGSAFSHEDPDYYAISEFYEMMVLGRVSTPTDGWTEKAEPPGFPWWVVRRTPPDTG